MSVKKLMDANSGGDWLTSLMQERKPQIVEECRKEDEPRREPAPREEMPPARQRANRGKLFWLLAVGIVMLTASQVATLILLPRRADPLPVPVPFVNPEPKPEMKPEPAGRSEFVVSLAGDGDYQSLSGAIAQAKPGIRIRVKPGLYRESLVLDKPVEIVGDGPVKDIVIESAGADCLLIKSDGVLIRGLSLRTRTELKDGLFYPLHITQGHVRIENCDVTSESSGCVVINGPGIVSTLSGCTIHDGKGDGVLIFDRAKGILQGCQILGHGRDGVVIATGANLLLVGCDIRDSKRDGIFADRGGQGILVGCSIENSTAFGVYCHGQDANLVMRDCLVRHGKSNGVVTDRGATTTLQGCQIHDNASASVAILEEGKLVLHGCKVYQGKNAGIFARGGSGVVSDCEIYSHEGSGIALEKRGNLAVHQCQLHDNRRGNWAVSNDSTLIGSGNQPAAPIRTDVVTPKVMPKS
jgi:F-box protein 11